MLFSGCQGKPEPKIIEERCPNCGEVIEMASTDVTGICDACGTTVINDKMKCVFWCDHAKECVGEEAYEAAMHSPDRIRYNEKEFERFTRW